MPALSPWRVLLVGAMRVETAPLIAALSLARPLGSRLITGHLGPHRLAVLTCGVGPDKAQERTAAALRRWAADAVINLGTAGSLRDELVIGTVVHASSLTTEAALRQPEGRPAAFSPPLCLDQPTGTVVTVQAPVFQAARRQVLADQGGSVCEMEATGILHACHAAGLPLAVVKIVSDLAGKDTPTPPAVVDRLRFKARALGLVQRGLLPHLPRMLATLDRHLG